MTTSFDSELFDERLTQAALPEQRPRVVLSGIGETVAAAGRVTVLDAGALPLTGWTAAEPQDAFLADFRRIIDEGCNNRVENSATRALWDGTTARLVNRSLRIASDATECARRKDQGCCT